MVKRSRDDVEDFEDVEKSPLTMCAGTRLANEVQKSPVAKHMGTRPANSKVQKSPMAMPMRTQPVNSKNLDPVNMEEENAEVTNSLEITYEDEELESEDQELSEIDGRSEYELNRATNLKRNLDFLHALNLGKKITLIDEDAYVVGLAYFPSDYVRILNAAAVVAAAKGEGISLPKRKNLKTTLTNFGLELVKSEKVKLAKTAGLTRDDVTIL